MSLDNYLHNKIPFNEACSFLVEFHKLGEDMVDPAAPPPTPDVVGLMGAVVQNEFRSLLAYTVYAQTLRDLAREGLAEEFQEHADEELEHAEFLLRRMAVLGGQPPLQDVPMPAPASDPVEIVNNLIQIEQESIAAWQQLHAAIGEDPAKYKIEEYLSIEQEHLDDLQRLLPDAQPAAAPPPVDAGTSPAPAAPPGAPPQKDGGGASVKVDLKPGGAGEKVAFMDPSVRPGTEHYHSARMLAALQGLPSKSYTPEGALDGVVDRFGNPVAEKWAASFKLAAGEMMGAPMESGPLPQQPDPRTSAWLQNEMEGQAAEGAASEEYYKQRFMEAQQQLEAATQAAEQAAQQAQQLQQQAEQNQMAITSAQNQAQQTSAMAMEQVMQAGDEKLQQQMQAAQMRMAFQEMRGKMLELASQEPPSQVLQDPAAVAAQGGAPGAVDPATGQPMAQPGAPQDPSAAPAGQPADPAAAPEQPASGGSSSSGSSESSDAASKGKGSTTVSVKQGSAPKVPDHLRKQLMRDGALVGSGLVSGGYFGHRIGKESAEKHASFREHALGAGLGAAMGGIGTALEGSGLGDSTREGLKKRIASLEQEQGSFPQTMRLVASKALLGGSEAAKAHPIGASIVGSLAGAGIGAATEPAIRSLVESGRRLLG